MSRQDCDVFDSLAQRRNGKWNRANSKVEVAAKLFLLNEKAEVLMGRRAGSIIEVARIEGKIFKTMKEAEAHGLELAREWVNKRCSEI